MTLQGKNGRIVATNRMEWLDLPGGISIFTGTWKVVSGNRAYRGLVGGGRVAGVMFANGSTRWKREGAISFGN